MSQKLEKLGSGIPVPNTDPSSKVEFLASDNREYRVEEKNMHNSAGRKKYRPSIWLDTRVQANPPFVRLASEKFCLPTRARPIKPWQPPEHGAAKNFAGILSDIFPILGEIDESVIERAFVRARHKEHFSD